MSKEHHSLVYKVRLMPKEQNWKEEKKEEKLKRMEMGGLESEMM